MNRIIVMIKRFILYGVCGIIAETVWTGLGSLFYGDLRLKSTTYLWMFPIYGMMILLEPLHNIIRKEAFVVRGLIYMLFFFAGEFVTGGILKYIIGLCPWDYGNEKYSLAGGVITLRFIPVWFLFGFVFEFIHDFLIYKERSDAWF